MSEIFYRGRRVIFVIEYKDKLHSKHTKAFLRAKKDFISLPPAFAFLSMVVSLRSQNWNISGNKSALNSKFITNSCSFFIGNLVFAIVCGGFYYWRIIRTANEIFDDERMTGNLSSHEIQMVEDREYFKSNMYLKCE